MRGFNQIGHYNVHIASKRPCRVKIEKVEGGGQGEGGHGGEGEGGGPRQQGKIINQTIKPLLKYVGGKTQILTDVMSRFPATSLIRNYYEPFVGGGSVLFAFLENNPEFQGRVVAGDINPRLINFYTVVRDNVDAFLEEMRNLVEAYKKEVDKESFYYTQRVAYNTHSSNENITDAALFLFLNKTGFRGLHRMGPHGFNVPFGHYSNPSIYDETHVRTVSKILKRCEFICGDFSQICADIEPADYVYLDPPYVPTDGRGDGDGDDDGDGDGDGDGKKDKKKGTSSFTGYNANGFTDHSRFFLFCENLKNKGVHWLMSNSDTILVRDKFSEGYQTTVISCRRTVNAKAPGSRVNEVLIYW